MNKLVNKWTEDINKAKVFNSADEAFNYARSLSSLPKSIIKSEVEA